MLESGRANDIVRIIAIGEYNRFQTLDLKDLAVLGNE